jgi:hypothetical protein
MAGNKKQKVNEDCNIQQFIKSIIGKNYAEANKYLQGVLDEKFKSRIRKYLLASA